MTTFEASFSTVPDAPTARALVPPLEETTPSVSEDPHLVPLSLPLLDLYLGTYPKLALDSYHLRRDSTGSNVLALVHNAAKREIVDLVGNVVPALESLARRSEHESLEEDSFGELRAWWNTLLRFFFFVAETDQDITRLMIEHAARVAKREGDFKRANALHRRRKSLFDRYAFTMEVIFRAADRALHEYEAEPAADKVTRAVEKFGAVANFMLDTMELSMNLACEAEDICDLQLNGLEYSVAESAAAFAREQRGLFMFLCVRWMKDEKFMKQWVWRYGGLRGRFFFDSWKKAHAEKRGAFIEELSSQFLNA